MSQAGPGNIHLFEDFFNANQQGATVADNENYSAIGPFMLFGQGADEADAGALLIADTPGGAVRLTTTNEPAHSMAVGTQAGFVPSSMGPLAMEARVQFNNLDTKTAFVGWSNDAAATAVAPVTGCTLTLTLSDADVAGFVLSATLTEDEMWHFTHNGGATAGPTASCTVQSCVCAVAGEWDVLRVEIDPNGTVRWYVNGVLKKTTLTAVCPDEHFAAYAMVQAAGCAVEELDIDYLEVKGSRDWTR